MTRQLDPFIFWKGISGLSQRFQSVALLQCSFGSIFHLVSKETNLRLFVWQPRGLTLSLPECLKEFCKVPLSRKH